MERHGRRRHGKRPVSAHHISFTPAYSPAAGAAGVDCQEIGILPEGRLIGICSQGQPSPPIGTRVSPLQNLCCGSLISRTSSKPPMTPRTSQPSTDPGGNVRATRRHTLLWESSRSWRSPPSQPSFYLQHQSTWQPSHLLLCNQLRALGSLPRVFTKSTSF